MPNESYPMQHFTSLSLDRGRKQLKRRCFRKAQIHLYCFVVPKRIGWHKKKKKKQMGSLEKYPRWANGDIRPRGRTCWDWREESRILHSSCRSWTNGTGPTSAFPCPSWSRCLSNLTWHLKVEPRNRQWMASMRTARWSCRWTAKQEVICLVSLILTCLLFILSSFRKH